MTEKKLRAQQRAQFDDEVRRDLKNAGDDVSAKGPVNWTRLHSAVMRGTISSVRLLVEKGADVNARDETGRSVLHLAVQHNTLEVVQYLVEHGAQINVGTSGPSNMTPLGFAKAFEKSDIAAWLEEQGAVTRIIEDQPHEVAAENTGGVLEAAVA